MAEEAEAEENKHKFRGVVLSLISDYETQFNCSSSKTVVHQGSKSDSCRLRERWRCFAALYFLDVVFSISIIGPAVVFIWRGVWDGGVLVAGEYGVSQTVSNTSAFLIGFIVTLLIDLFHSEIRSIGGKPGSIRHHIAHRMYSLCWGVFDICFWKGIWDGINHFGGKTWHFSLATLVLGIVILTISGVLKSSLSIPIGISVYDPEHHISCTTFLNANRKQSSSRWFADGLVSRGLELFVVLSWHGMWSLIDIITDKCFGLSFEHSTLVSLVLGLVGVLILLFLQSILLELAPAVNQNHTVAPLWWEAANFLFTLIGIFVTINWFRTIWNGMDILYFPGNPYISYFTPVLIGWVVLLVCGCCSCMHAGLYEDNPKLGISITFHYFSHNFAQRIKSSGDDKTIS